MSERSVSGLSLTRVDRLTARLVTHDWAWAREHAEAIDRDWQRRLAEKPSMFDGPVLLSRGCQVGEGVCEAALFETRFSRFVAFREAGAPDPDVFNAFSAIVPHTADGAVLLGEMAPHTANAGQIYFPCGTPDRDDIREGGLVDLAGSAERELLEETGLALPDGAVDAPWVLLSGEGRLAFLRPVRFPQSADELVARIDGHLTQEEEPELERIIVVRAASDIDDATMPGFARAYLRTVFR